MCIYIKIIVLVFCIAFTLCSNRAISQNDILKRTVTAKFENVKINDAFRQIETQHSIYFTFDGSLININKIMICY